MTIITNVVVFGSVIFYAFYISFMKKIKLLTPLSENEK